MIVASFAGSRCRVYRKVTALPNNPRQRSPNPTLSRSQRTPVPLPTLLDRLESKECDCFVEEIMLGQGGFQLLIARSGAFDDGAARGNWVRFFRVQVRVGTNERSCITFGPNGPRLLCEHSHTIHSSLLFQSTLMVTIS